MSDWISWIKAQSSEIVESVKNESIVLGGSLVESVKEITDQASKVVESLANDENVNDEDENDLNDLRDVEDEEANDAQANDKSNSPDNSLIEKLDLMAANTEDYLDSLASNVTFKIGNFLSKAITIIPDSPEITLVSDRRSNLLLEMQKDPDTYATDYAFVQDEGVVKRYHNFLQSFSIKDHQQDIIEILEEFSTVKDFFRKMVPQPLDDETFWGRYFFKITELEYQENARSIALKEALDNKDDVIWDDSDDEFLKEDAPVVADKDAVPVMETNQENTQSSIESESNKVSESTIMQPQLIVDQKLADSEIHSPEQEIEQKIVIGKLHVENELETSQNTENNVRENLKEHQEKNSEPNLPETDQKTEFDTTHDSKVGKIPVKDIKPLLLPVDGKSSPNSEGSFDIVRKESVQPLEIQTPKDLSQEGPNSDDGWGGWDDSPDSALEEY